MDAEIFDMDGTLCDVAPIRHYVMGERRDFDAFHKAGTTLCGPNEYVAEAARSARLSGRKVLVVSARDARWAWPTIRWLDAHAIPVDDAWFRARGDRRSDVVVKREIYADIVSRGYRVIRAWDDNPAIVALWAELGVPCEVVPGWLEEGVQIDARLIR